MTTSSGSRRPRRFDQYVGYSSGQGLIEQAQDRVAITPKGKSFLMYLVHESRPFRRPF